MCTYILLPRSTCIRALTLLVVRNRRQRRARGRLVKNVFFKTEQKNKTKQITVRIEGGGLLMTRRRLGG